MKISETVWKYKMKLINQSLIIKQDSRLFKQNNEKQKEPLKEFFF